MNLPSFPSVSVVIPSWNQGRFIERTLLSILKQDYPGSVEIIVSDGGSTDETVQVLKKYDKQLIWWSAPDKGFVDAVTKGVARATGQILAIQSSDDYYLPGAFRAMAEAFQQYPEASFVSGGEYAIDLEGEVQWSRCSAGTISPRSILLENVPAQHATFVKRRYFEETGGMRPEVDMCADMDLWYRVAHLAPGHYIPTILAVYQVHPTQRTQTSTKWYDSLVRMVETCEQDPRYGRVFRLTDYERRSLYTNWRISWAGQVDRTTASRLALRELPHYFSYDAKTRQTIWKSTGQALFEQARSAARHLAMKVLPEATVARIQLKNKQAALASYAHVPFSWWQR